MKESSKPSIKDLNFRKNVDPAFRRGTNKQLLELNNLKLEYKKCEESSEIIENELEKEKLKLQDLYALVEKLRNELAAAQEEIDADYLPEGAQPRPRIHNRDRILMEVGQAEVALEAQKTSTNAVSEKFILAEKELFQADRNISRFAETLEDTMLAMATIKELDKQKADKLANLDDKVAKRKERDRKLAEEAKEAQMKEMQEIKTKQLKASKLLNKEATQKLAQSHALTRETTAKVKEMSDAEQKDRADAVLELKANQNAVRDKMVTMAVKHKKKVEAAKKQLEDEKEAILSRGLNPYIEFRRKEIDEEADRQEKKLREAVEQNKKELAERMKKEEKFFEKQAKTKRVEKEYEKKHRESQGRHVVEEKNAEYIINRTSSHLEILDPSGKAARVDPSQITDIPDYSFGLGKSSRIPPDSMKRITGQIRESLKVEKEELGEYKRLVTGLLKKVEGSSDSPIDRANQMRSTSAPSTSGVNLSSLEEEEEEEEEESQVRDLSSLVGLASQPGLMPGVDKAATVVNFGGNNVEKASLLQIAVEEEGGINDGSGGIRSAKKPKYPVAGLSKFERSSLARASEKHRDRIELGTEQVAGGRTFKGVAFVSKPDQILFQDFEVGKKYKKHFTLTNVSYTFNSFKLLDLTDEFIDFFVINYEKPGRMSAGVSCSLEIAFTPKINSDILTKIRFFTETGPVEVPLKCLIRRCAPRITNPVVDFGSLVIGQTTVVQIKIRNSQALNSKFQITPYREGEVIKEVSDVPEEEVKKEEIIFGEDDNLDEPINTTVEPAMNETELDMRVQRVVTQVWRRKKRDNPFPLSATKSEGVVDGYGNASVDVLCAPLTIGQIEQKFSVVFEGVDESFGSINDLGELVMREQTITTTTCGEEVPVYMAEEVMDFKCVLFDRIYRKKIVVKNRAKAAYRVVVKVSPKFQKYVEVTPSMFFVQAKSYQSINIKFTPTSDMISKLSYFLLPYESFEQAALISLPIELEAVNQELPVFFLLKASVCQSTVQLSCSHLDFGKVYVGQKSVKKVTLKNCSMLPQKIAFVRLRREFLVSPNDGFAVLLPNETTEFEISFGPMSAIDYDLVVTLLTSSNDSYDIKVAAEGIEPPLEMSSSVIKMRSTAPGERVVESTMVRNKTSHPQCFEIVVPDKLFSWLTVSPSVVNLEPGQSSRLEVEYLPPSNAEELQPSDWYNGIKEQETNPFDQWLSDSGWEVGKGKYGEIQWYKPLPKEQKKNLESSDNDQELQDTAAIEQEHVNEEQPEDSSNLSLHCDLPPEEWGVNGTWNFPILIKQRRKQSESLSNTSSPMKGRPAPLPLFLSVHTTVKLPFIDADIKVVDFGQISVGIRQLKTFKIYNKSYMPIKLQSIGLNAVGPFTLLRPIKEVPPRESRVVIVECLPAQPGLVVEVLEVSMIDDSNIGHRIRVTMRVQGLKPSIQLEGLNPPPPNWNPRCGILDFNDCLMLDTVVKKFTIKNKSTFSIDAKLIRIVGTGLSPVQQAELIERNAAGLPIFSFTPERVIIAEGGSQDIEVVFRPDRGRFHPFREDIDIIIGKTDEIYRVGIFGRSWSRQLFVRPSDPRDESFPDKKSVGLSKVEDSLLAHASITVRSIASDFRNSLKLKFPYMPVLTLEYPDPFREGVDVSSFIEVGSAPVGAKGGAKAAAVVASSGARQQTKELTFSGIKVLDSRPGAGAGSFEVILSAEAKESGLWSVSVDKGSITPGTDLVVDVICTLPKPRSLGGIFVGSWKSFKAVVVLKGGWRSSDESEENRLPVTLKAYVSL